MREQPVQLQGAPEIETTHSWVAICGTNPLKALKCHCYECICGEASTGRGLGLIRDCHRVICPVWPFRMGKKIYKNKQEYLTDKDRCKALADVPVGEEPEESSRPEA